MFESQESGSNLTESSGIQSLLKLPSSQGPSITDLPSWVMALAEFSSWWTFGLRTPVPRCCRPQASLSSLTYGALCGAAHNMAAGFQWASKKGQDGCQRPFVTHAQKCCPIVCCILFIRIKLLNPACVSGEEDSRRAWILEGSNHQGPPYKLPSTGCICILLWLTPEKGGDPLY